MIILCDKWDAQRCSGVISSTTKEVPHLGMHTCDGGMEQEANISVPSCLDTEGYTSQDPSLGIVPSKAAVLTKIF